MTDAETKTDAETMTNAETFKKNNFVIVRNFLDPFLVKYLASYYREVRDHGAGQFHTDWTSLNCNGDTTADAVLYSLRSTIEAEIGLKLWPTYSFVRIYKKGDSVGRHKDSPANQISCNMNIARGDVDWPLGVSDGETNNSVIFQPGDAMIYRGFMLDHWREKFQGDHQVQLIVGFVVQDGRFDGLRFYGRGKPMYQPKGVRRAGPVKLTKAVLWRIREAYRKRAGTE